MANQELVFDITKSPQLQPKQQAIYGRVGDGGLKGVTIKVTSNNEDYNLTGMHPIFEGVKPDGTKIIDTNGGTIIDPQGGIFRYVFPSAAFSAKGEYQQAFFKLMRDSLTDSTVELSIYVEPNKVEMGINSTHYLSEYEQLIQQLEDKTTQFENDLRQQDEQWKQSIADALKKMDDLATKEDELEKRLDGNDFVTHEELSKGLEAFGKPINESLEKINQLMDRYLPVGFDVSITHNYNMTPRVVVKHYTYAIDTEPKGFDSEKGKFGGTPSQLVPCEVTYTDYNSLVVTLPAVYKRQTAVVKSKHYEGIWYVPDGTDVLKIELKKE